MSLTSWFLVSGGGTRHRLPREMIFVGRDDCELMLQSRSVDKQHAVINYEPNTDEHKVKDLGSLNGTFVNDVRIQEQIYVTLKIDDKLRFGYDTNLFTVVRGELHIPEEALKHEKLSSQLQLNQKKPMEAETAKSEVKPSEAAAAPVCEGAAAKPPEASRVEDKTTVDVAVLHRGTPLYGQPAWWGDGDTDEQQSGRPEEKSSDRKREKAETDTRKNETPKSALQTMSNQEPSYFEIPTKDTPSGGKADSEAPSREPDASSAAEPVHGHASFTIEFDPGASGKVTVKDRVAKVGPETRPRPKRAVGEELSPLQTAMVAAEVKVADWLAQNELPLALKETAAEEDGESVKSDVPVHLRSLKGSKHEDGTQSDSENALGDQRRAAVLEERSWGLWGGPGMKIREGRANVPEGLFAEEDSPARRRKTSNSKAASGLVERRRGSAPHQQSGRDECCHHGDDFSDRGTYTIELENGDHEEEEVFGVDEQEPVCVSRLGVGEQRERITSQRSGAGERGKPGRMETEVLPEELMVGGPRWVSQWATLAASHIRTDPEGSGGETHIMVTEDRAEISESRDSTSFASSGYTERKRRTLPQLPGEEVGLGRRTPGSGLRMDMGEKQDTELQEKESQEEKLTRGKNRPGYSSGGVGSHSGSPSRSSPAKSQDSGGGRSSQSGVLAKLPPRPLTSGEKRMEEARRRKKEDEKAKESGGKPLLRQESFTVEKPSANVPIELIPRIDGYTGSRTQSKETGIDSSTLQKDSEAVAAFLETTVSDQGDPPSQSIEGSMSPESDVDTTSTVSQADGARRVVQKRRTLTGQQKEKTIVCSSSKGPAGSQESQERRVKTRAAGPQQPNRPWTSLDLTDDDVNSNSLLSDSQPASTQGSRGSHARAQTGSTTVGASTRSSRAKSVQAPTSAATKSSSVPKPRPTRASLLRRARLGDSSDTEAADMDRMSVASEASTASSTSRTGMARRGMSRIEALAQPRRPRVGSPSAQSDSEATVTRSRGVGARSAAGDYALRQGLRASNVTQVSGPRARANSASKLPDKSKGSSSYGHATPASGTRWRRIPVEYASTSEDEYGSNRHISKQSHTQPFASTRVAQLGGSAPPTPNPTGLSALKQHSREQDEYMRDWTAHSEEIARISQDLAKDLAMLAREIHDVAGEIDSVSPAANDPGALLEERVFDDSLELGGPSAEHSGTGGTNGRSVELRPRGTSGSRSIRRQTWNRDDAALDSLLLASVTQLSTRIRQSVDKTTCKIRILFKDKELKWEEIESKLQAEHDSLLLKSSNKEISTIIQDLRRVERQLLVIDMMVDPDGTLDALTTLGLTSPLSDQKISPRAQLGASGLLQPGPETSSVVTTASRPEGPEPCGPSEQAEV
ncbi:centrosomal protein of 170 kDa isoform X2 [Sphaeramia orbicularis]|uniref:centrosomal protein of 170 kDa isoform X2 n=1 Tax=Sphaeramia orbicularis TaxID=375764 RepID=UPI00117FCA5F|nr:centrosomal protein of 170 kDa-like isoform X2 [Sphaeramia orbicularis]